MNRTYKYLIIGAGPTGLGAAYRLKELGETDFLVLERSSKPGGLAASYVDENGFTWDTGGHVQFSHYKYFDDLMTATLGEDGWLYHERESWVWIKDRFVPYPFQSNIRYLPKETMWKCLEGLINLYKGQRDVRPKNLEQWIYGTFGTGIAEEFMIPYNQKVWAHRLSDLAFDWIGERVVVPDLHRVMENILFEKDDLSWGPNNAFRFPKCGGTGAVWESTARLIGPDFLRFNSEITSINLNEQAVLLSDGSIVGYQHLLSTIPLDILATRIEGIDTRIRLTSARLMHSTVHIVGIGLRGKPRADVSRKCWMYFPEGNCPFYRVTVFSNYSPQNVPDITKYWSLMTETSESQSKPVDGKAIVEETIEGLLNTGLIERTEGIVSRWHFVADHGYPIPTLDRDEILQIVLPYLEHHQIYSRGRFGAWKYEVSNQDHSLMQGVEWVNKMVLGIPELTLHYPDVANANWGKR